MIELLGKYNRCKVFIDNIDNNTISQIITLLNQQSIAGSTIRIMPDCHAGAGCVIGTTMTIADKVIPNLVGVDIGCGMLAVKLSEDKINFELLDQVIRENIPSGFDVHDQINDAVNKELKDMSVLHAPIDQSYAKRSLGTLGGGNHFIEVDKDSNGDLWLVIHTGSRHLGVEICNYYQNLAWQRFSKDNLSNEIKELIYKLKSEGREKEIEQNIEIIKMNHKSLPNELCYLEGEDFIKYIDDMKYAQYYASLNRFWIAAMILYKMDLHFESRFDTIHNYIDTENMILRKGAISAQQGEQVLIPMNMRDGSLICMGKGNPDWNYSAPHGAGRILSRAAAKNMISMEDFKTSMQGIYSTSIKESTLDESPMAYKPMRSIIDNIRDTVDVINTLKPVYNFKAS